jgi:gluconolactonase
MQITSNLTVLCQELYFPEGPAFAADGTLWFVEQLKGSLSEYKHGVLTRHDVGGRPNGIAIDKKGLVWFCDSIRNQIRTYDPKTARTTTILSQIDNHPLNLPNDLAFDQAGNLLFTCSGEELDKGDGYFCAWSPEGKLYRSDAIRFYPNGLALHANGQQLYIAETGTHRIWRGNWDSESLSWDAPSIFTETGGPIGPDGMAFDEEGRLYVAVFGSSSIHVYDQEGKLVQKIGLSGTNPTNCAFDPYGKLGLVITETEKGQLLSHQTELKGIISL